MKNSLHALTFTSPGKGSLISNFTDPAMLHGPDYHPPLNFSILRPFPSLLKTLRAVVFPLRGTSLPASISIHMANDWKTKSP